MAARHYLFLQGLRSPFFDRLAKALRAAGQQVTKVHFHTGDWLYWTGTALSCRSTVHGLDSYYAQMLDTVFPTDVVLFGDCRPVHVHAIAQAKKRNIPVHVFEEGYFRPHWVTLEQGGVNGFSGLPRAASWYRRCARLLPSQSQPISLKSGLKARVIHDVTYNLAGTLNPIFYPHYPSHVGHSIPAEYAAYVKRVVHIRSSRGRDAIQVDRLAREGDYFLLALQVIGDAQLRFHSSYENAEILIDEVLTSFARHARPDTRLVIKNHPLDPGLVDYRRIIDHRALNLGISSRVIFLETGHLPTLLDHALGLVTVNSTTIGQALFHGCPVKMLGRGIFNIDGLTHEGSLDAFWNHPGTVDQALFHDVQQVITYATQINGGLHSHQGITLAVEHARSRLMEKTDRLTSLKQAVPLQEAA